MLKLDLGGVGRDGEWKTINLDDSGYRFPPDVVCDITAHAHELEAHFDYGSVDAIRCIHTLEHLPQWDILPTLDYWRKFLKPGGELIIVVPDMRRLLEDYCEAKIPLEVVMALTYVSGFRTIQGPGEEHRWGFDFNTLRMALIQAGYVNSAEVGDTFWPEYWMFDFPDMMHTGCVGYYLVRNLRVRAHAPS